jgi:cytoskeletal protein CcmA (bactofilin family)
MDQSPQDLEEVNSLEAPSTVIEPAPGIQTAAVADSTPQNGIVQGAPHNPQPPKLFFGNRLRRIISRINIYLLAFILIVILAVVIVFVASQKSKKPTTTGSLNTQTLNQSTLDQLKGSDASLGDPKQTLNVESNAVFAGKVLVRDSLEVAGSLKIGGALSLPGITVAGNSAFDQIQANGLSVSGNAAVQGGLNVKGSLTVGGGASFTGPISSPQISVISLQLNGDLQLNHHIDAGGSTPGHSNGSALGSGGTSSNTGTDTAGTVTINTGGSPPAGCFITINFTQKFNATPHVVITPASSDSAGIAYYVNRNTTSFSVCATNPAGAKNYVFDYIVID